MIANQTVRKSAQWEPSCFLQTDGQTNVTKLINAFYKFSKPPKTRKLFQNIKCDRQTDKDTHKQHGESTACITPINFLTKKAVGLLD